MYVPSHFEVTDPQPLRRLMEQHPLGVLVTNRGGRLEADHLPFETEARPEPHGRLLAHVARANPLWREAHGAEVLVIFQGPSAYVTPSWYPTKRETGKVVPTWNYAVVHAYGTLRAIEDREWLRAFVTRLTDRHERARGEPWRVSDAPADYIDKMLGAIVGIEIAITRLVGKWKMSQNRTPADRAGVVDGLKARGGADDLAMARFLEEYGKPRRGV